MKTADEIKNGLDFCISHHGICDECPNCGSSLCPMDYAMDIACLIQRLEEDKARAEASCAQLSGTIRYLRKQKNASASWISVEERLPGDDHDWVLAIGKFVPENTYGKPIISELRKDGKWWGDINDEFPLEYMGIRITHWMPLPEPPKEE